MRGERSATTATAALAKQAGPPPRVASQESAAREEPLLDMQQQVGNRETTRAIGGGQANHSGSDDNQSGAHGTAAREVTADDREARAEADAEREKTAAPPFTPVVEDDAEHVGAQQMRKSEFLEALRVAVSASADEGMPGAGNTSMVGPYINQWIAEYQDKSVAHLERAIRKFAPEAAGASSASKVIALLTARVRRSVDQGARTGQITGLPGAASAMMPGAGLFGGVFFKARPGGAHVPSGGAHAIRSQLGSGRALDGQVRGRMERAFGVSFARVRLHTGPTASRLSEQMNAHAFTVGRDVAFGAGRYHPGNPVGDALIAHELAHVVQQRSTSEAADGGGAGARESALRQETAPLEADADRSAVGAVARLWSGTRSGLANLRQHAGPRLRSGLTLSRCSGCGSKSATKVGSKIADADAKTTGGADGTPPAECKTTTEIDDEKAAIVNAFGFSSVVTAADGSCWTLAELQKVHTNLDRVPANQQSAFKGVKLQRIKKSTCKSDASGCFKSDTVGAVQNDRLEIPDKYFKDDANATGLLPSQETTLHEAGHAFETQTLRETAKKLGEAQIAQKAPDATLTAAIAQWNSTSTTIPPLTFSNPAEQRYVNAIEGAARALVVVIDPIATLNAAGKNHTSAQLTAAAKTTQGHVTRAKTAIAGRNTARRALPASSSVISAASEAGQNANFAASEALVKAIEASAAAQKKVEDRTKEHGAASVRLQLSPTLTIDVSRRLAELVALVNLQGVNVATSGLSTHATGNWPGDPAELYATLYQLSVTDPARVTAFDAEVGAFFRAPIGPKGRNVARVNTWITSHTAP